MESSTQKPSSALFEVYLRLRPSSAADRERFLDVESSSTESNAPTHITIKPPADDKRKRAIERFGFTRVFEHDAAQREIFESTGVVPMLDSVLGRKGKEGRDGLVATLGVTGSGKSHTILGSKSQRGITQLTLDLLFQNVDPYLADFHGSVSTYQSLCSSDVSEGQIMPASTFLDGLHNDTAPSRCGTPARGATPGMVRDTSSSSPQPPGAFPPTQQEPSARSNEHHSVFERLYPSLAKYQNHAQHPIKPCPKSLSSFNHITRSVAKLTGFHQQETSLLSAVSTSTRRATRHAPRASTLPTQPSIDDIDLPNVDPDCEYAIVISMYEVHNDRIYDLLTSPTNPAPNSKSLPPKRRHLLFKPTEASPDRKSVTGLRKILCTDLADALLTLETGLLARRVADTRANATSSRSHGFFQIEVKKRPRSAIPHPWASATLSIVDLAGSERARTAKTAGATLAEAGKINESLMYLGQCMQLQADNALAPASASNTAANIVPYRQCKLTELLFSNSMAPGGKPSQRAVMLVTADPWGDYNATSQILRYSALAREVAVPRVPSLTAAGVPKSHAQGQHASGRASPSSANEELARLRAELEMAQLELAAEKQRRVEAESSWVMAEQRVAEVEAEVREEVWTEMEERLVLEQRRGRAAREVEEERRGEVWDAKVDILSRGADGGEIYEDEEESEGREGGPGAWALLAEVQGENARLRERVAGLEAGGGKENWGESPSKKRSAGGQKPVRVLKSRRWDGSGMGVGEF